MTATSTPPRPAESTPRPQPRHRRVLALGRNTWRALTSMRTALVLLFLVALAAIPGAMLPQRSLNKSKVAGYITEHPTVGPVLDRFEFFDVFSSFWFTSIYVLLFVSLVGCIVPRCVDHARALRTPPVPVPRNLRRLPHHHHASVDEDPDVVVARVRSVLTHWRVRVEMPRAGEIAVSAEKGYLRELGNLVFHLSLVGLLVAVAIGKLYSYEGNVIVIADDGPGFCTTSPAVFDSFRAGNVRDGTGMAPICIRVENFRADYLDNGQAEQFTSDIRYQAGEDLATGRWREETLQVNRPLRVSGDRVYLQGHGYAPTFTVTFPNGETRTETLQWQPDDAQTFLSSGAMRFDPPGGMYPDPDERRRNQIAIEGLFAPTAVLRGELLTSSFPEMTNPAVAVDIYRGDTGLDTGLPQPLFSLTKELVNQGRLIKDTRVNLAVGETATLQDGTTTVTFDGAKEFVNLQVSHDPAQGWVLVFAIAMMAGLLVSLLVKRRRIWVRIHDADLAAARTTVDLGGLARTDRAGWGEEFDRLAARILTVRSVPRAPGPSPRPSAGHG